MNIMDKINKVCERNKREYEGLAAMTGKSIAEIEADLTAPDPGLRKTHCGKCHTCGTPLRQVLDGEEWCPTCRAYRRYRSHGWSSAIAETTARQCPAHHWHYWYDLEVTE